MFDNRYSISADMRRLMLKVIPGDRVQRLRRHIESNGFSELRRTKIDFLTT